MCQQRHFPLFDFFDFAFHRLLGSFDTGLIPSIELLCQGGFFWSYDTDPPEILWVRQTGAQFGLSKCRKGAVVSSDRFVRRTGQFIRKTSQFGNDLQELDFFSGVLCHDQLVLRGVLPMSVRQGRVMLGPDEQR